MLDSHIDALMQLQDKLRSIRNRLEETNVFLSGQGPTEQASLASPASAPASGFNGRMVELVSSLHNLAGEISNQVGGVQAATSGLGEAPAPMPSSRGKATL